LKPKEEEDEKSATVQDSFYVNIMISGVHHPLISPVNKLGLRHPRKGDFERK